MRTALLHATEGFELSARLTDTRHGHHLQFISFVPSARRPEPQVRYEALLSSEQLVALRDLIDAQMQCDRSTSNQGPGDCIEPPELNS